MHIDKKVYICKTNNKLKTNIMRAILKFDKSTRTYTAKFETIHFQKGSLPLIDTTLNGKPTIEYGLNLKEGVEYLNSFNTGLEIIII